MKTFFAMVLGFLLFLATSLVLAHSHGNAVLPAVIDSTTLFAADFVSGKESGNAAVWSLTIRRCFQQQSSQIICRLFQLPVLSAATRK